MPHEGAQLLVGTVPTLQPPECYFSSFLAWFLSFCPTLISVLDLGLDEQRLRSHSSVRPREKWSLWP